MNEIVCLSCGTGVDEHESSQCLDEWVATVVMKEPKPVYIHDWQTLAFKSALSDGGNWTCFIVYAEGDIPGWHPKPFSSQIEAAWKVVKQLITVPYSFEFYLGQQTDGWDVSFEHPENAGGHARAKTAPLAICQAAIKAASND